MEIKDQIITMLKTAADEFRGDKDGDIEVSDGCKPYPRLNIDDGNESIALYNSSWFNIHLMLGGDDRATMLVRFDVESDGFMTGEEVLKRVSESIGYLHEKGSVNVEQ